MADGGTGWTALRTRRHLWTPRATQAVI
jgi:hypothetical protein